MPRQVFVQIPREIAQLAIESRVILTHAARNSRRRAPFSSRYGLRRRRRRFGFTARTDKVAHRARPDAAAKAVSPLRFATAVQIAKGSRLPLRRSSTGIG